jgi:hypothetical protein
MKTKINLLIILISVVIILTNSCRRPYECCIWEKETTSMNVNVGKMNSEISYQNTTSLDSLDTCKYNLFRINMSFNTKYLPYETCSCPEDSIVGKIESILIICNNDYNSSFKSGDTINSMISCIYQKENGIYLEEPILINDYLQSYPNCNLRINLFLNQPTDTTCLQSFTIYYKETDGTIFSATTKPIYVTP